MTRTQWLLLGAVLLGLAVGLYILFFCPAVCQ
jgi:type II secretory pathway component PulM